MVPADNSAMHPLLTAVLNEAALMVERRGWTWPPQSTLADAERLAAHSTNRGHPFQADRGHPGWGA